MRTLYLDCFSGIAGDMLLGALIDLGWPLDELNKVISKLGLADSRVTSARVERAGVPAMKCEVVIGGNASHRSLTSIEAMIERADLAGEVKRRAKSVFRRIGVVEAEVHAVPIEKIHFHEIGAVDSLVDIVGNCAGLVALGIEQVICSPLNVGHGRVQTAHGMLPVPAPATAKLLEGMPVYSLEEVEGELVTPTGAALVKEFAIFSRAMPRMTLKRSGAGAGTKELAHHPNVVRAFLGEADAIDSAVDRPSAQPPARIWQVEANLDDVSPEVCGYVMERAFALGALDVFFTPIQMKKNRPGVTITALCAPSDRGTIAELLFMETTTLGVRFAERERVVLEREEISVSTRYGSVRVKVARFGEAVHFAPEYDDCAAAARERGVALRDVCDEAVRAAQESYGRE